MAREVGRARGATAVVAVVLVTALGVAPAAADHNQHDHDPGGAGRGDQPNAVGLDSRSRTYVGFADGPGLVRIGPRGRTLRPWRLPGTGPVTALDVTRHDRVWITDGRTARLVGRDGDVEKTLVHGPEDGCSGREHRARRYGGLESWRRMLFVGNRCDKTVEVFRYDGTRIAQIPVPGKGHPRGLTLDPGTEDRPPRLYVAFPDRAKVLAFNGRRWRDGEEPVRVLRIRKPSGGVRPEPAGIVVERGQLLVTDVANHALYFYDSTHAFSRYRVLGHPPRPGSRMGHLRRPVALAQHRQDGSRFAGALVLADAGNERVQRWNTYGWTYWSATVRVPRQE